MRELVIIEYKKLIDSRNEYWRGWGESKKGLIRSYPDFETMLDEELLEKFIRQVQISSQPMC